MIGLSFLAVGLLWFALSLFIAIKLPRWIGIKREELRWVLSGVLLLVFMVGPFVDHMVGMRQFEKLCSDARTSIQVSASIDSVVRAKTNETVYVDVPGKFINIQTVRREYIDVDTNLPFLKYETYFTSGGKVGGVLMLGGKYSCQVDGSPQFLELWKRYNIEKLMDKGRKS